MSSTSHGASTSGRSTDRDKIFEEGEEYVKLSLVLLAERGYNLSKDVNSQFSNFAIGREVGIGDDKNLDDIVFRYEHKDDEKHLILVQIKHKQSDSLKINSQILSGSWYGQWGRDFKLRKYFNSYLSIREELKTTKFKELKDSKINYVVIFTNADIDEAELQTKGFKFEEAPDDIKNLFTFKKSSIVNGEFTPCYQLGGDYDYLRSFFEKCSDLHRIAKEFMHVVVQDKKTDKCKNYIMETDKAPFKQYHVALGKEVIEKSNTTENKSPEKHKMGYQPYCIAKFRNEFLDNNEQGTKKELLDAILEAIREKSKINTSNDDLKEELRKAYWKVVPNFGQNKNSGKSFPNKWNDENPSELRKIAIEVANYITSNTSVHETFIKNYEVVFQKETIKIACVARFRKDFIDNNEQGTKKELLDAILKAIREKLEIHTSDDDDLKEKLRKAEWKVVRHFGHYLPTDCFELSRIGKKLAKYVIDEKEREKIILGKKESPMSHYGVAFQREVFEISDEVKYKSSNMQNTTSESYCDAKFCDEFISNSKNRPKLELRKAIFYEIRELDKSKQNASDYELENILRVVKLKVDKHFGKIQTFKEELPDKWPTIEDDDIKNFLKCLVLFVRQPDIKELITEISSPKESFLEGSRLGEVFCTLHQKFKDRIEKTLGIHNKDSNEEMWLYGGKIIQFVQELQDTVYTCVRTLGYEDEILKYGSFNTLGNLQGVLGNFFNCKSKVLCICTTMTLLTALKVLQYLVSKDYGKQYGQIFIETEDFNNDRVVNAFRSESNNLLIIHIKQPINQQIVKEFYDRFFDIINGNPNKKRILIIGENLGEKFRCYLKNLWKGHWNFKKYYFQQSEDINFKDFVPENNFLEKEFILFQEQERKVSVAALTGIDSWDCFVDYISDSKFQNKRDIIDIITEILIGNKVDVGCKPPGTSRLDGAYATLFEEVNTETLTNKLLSKELAGDPEEIYIICGIRGYNKEENLNKLIKYLRLVDNLEKIKNQLGEIGSDCKIQIADDDEFNDENFQSLCHNYPTKQIFWICVKHKEDEVKFILQQFYNPKFYLKRTFKNVVIKKEIREQLIGKNLCEVFLFYCVKNRNGLIDYLKFTNKDEKEEFENNCKNGKIWLFTLGDDVEASFQEICKQNESKNVHWLKLEEDQLIWCQSHGSLKYLRMYIDHEQNETSLVEEDNLIKQIKYRKVVLIADDPGMGKTSSLTRLYEAKDYVSESFAETHWVIRINLKDHIQAIRTMELKNNDVDISNVVTFLSKVDLKLNNNLSKNLLQIALNKDKYFLKPLLLAFDGFDEILDEDERRKIISLLVFLNNKTAAKLWVTTRLHFQQTLEHELSTFAIEFDPMNDEAKVAYVRKYLKDRLCLLLSRGKFMGLFVNNEEQENNRIQKYIKVFLDKMESVFKSNACRFIGTPLQLHLMLEGSLSHFRNWIENSDQNPDFNCLVNDVLEVYKKFINRKYDIYFKKFDIKGDMQQKQNKFFLNQCNKDFAKSLILNSQQKKTLTKFKDIILSAGIIKAQDSNIEFIHTTFRDYFAAKVFIHCIKKYTNELSNTMKQKYLLKEIFKKPDYQVIRTFMDIKLQKISQLELAGENLKEYGKIIKNMSKEEQTDLVYGSKTLLHIAVKEGNSNIVCFLLNILKEHRDILKKFLFSPCEFKKSALHLACELDEIKIVRLLLDAAVGISEDALQEFIYLYKDNQSNALDEVVLRDSNVEILKELLKRANSKLNLIVNKEKKYSSFCLACERGKEEYVKALLCEFEYDENSVKHLLLYNDRHGNSLYWANCHNIQVTVVEYLLSAAKEIKDNDETLKKLLVPNEGTLPFNQAVCSDANIEVVEKLLNAAKDINDDYQTLKKMLLNDITRKSALLDAASAGCCDIIKLLLETAADLSIEMLEKLIFAVDESDMNAIDLMVENGHEEIVTDAFEILEKDEYQYIKETVQKSFDSIPLNERLNYAKRCLISSIKNNEENTVEDILYSAKISDTSSKEKLIILLLAKEGGKCNCNTLYIACEYGHLTLIITLLSYAINIDDEGATLKELIKSPGFGNKTPFEALKNGYNHEVREIIESLILEAENNNNEHVVNILQEVNSAQIISSNEYFTDVQEFSEESN